jgi:hypothetical protein
MFLLALVSCVGTRQSIAPSDATANQKRIRTELYFGLAKPTGQVSADEWRAFLDDVVTPRFPQGLTVCDAYGQWSGDGVRVKKESSKLLILIHDEGAAQEAAVEEIRAEYKKRFQQESVLRVDTPVKASF